MTHYFWMCLRLKTTPYPHVLIPALTDCGDFSESSAKQHESHKTMYHRARNFWSKSWGVYNSLWQGGYTVPFSGKVVPGLEGPLQEFYVHVY